MTDLSNDQVLVNSSLAVMFIAVISHNKKLALNHISNCGIGVSVLLVQNVNVINKQGSTNILK
jgi:hypothetical protein